MRCILVEADLIMMTASINAENKYYQSEMLIPHNYLHVDLNI